MSSNNKSPIFPFPQPPQFTDYVVFDHQIDYFQKNILEETRKHMGLFRFKDDTSRKFKKSGGGGGRKRWWKNALRFLKWNDNNNHNKSASLAKTEGDVERGPHRNRGRVRSVYGPVYYIGDSRSGCGKPHRSISRPSSVPLAGSLTPAGKGEMEIPYVSLRDVNMETQQYYRMPAPSALPIYLVT